MGITSVTGPGAAPVKTSQNEASLTVAKATFSSTAVAAQGASSNEVVTIAKSMEQLLDGFTGAGRKPAGQAGSGSGPAKGFSSAALDRAREGKAVLDKLASARSDFANNLGKALDDLKGTFGNVLGQLGASPDQISGALKDFSKDLQDKMKSFDFSELAVNYEQSATQFTIESHGIDLVVQDGDRKMTISYAKSTLDLHREDQSLQAQVTQDGSGAVRVGASTLDADGKAEGLIINAKGFSAEEVQQVLDNLNALSSGGSSGGSGLAVLTPEKKADGILKLKLDLSAILPPAGSAATAAPAAAAGGGLNVTA